MRIAFLLLHDQRFSGWSINDFVYKRYHFAKDYAKRLGELGNEVILYTMHESASKIEEYDMDGYMIKIFPIKKRFPPFVPIGNSYNPDVVEEMDKKKFDIVHFHNYYFWSFIPIALAKRGRKNKWRLFAQYHGEPELSSLGKLIHSPWLRYIDSFLIPKIEEISWLRIFNVEKSKIIRFPNVGVDLNLFRKICDYEESPQFTYVGRMTLKSKNMREKNPWIIIEIMKKLSKHIDDFKLLMVGDGPGLGALKSYCNSIGLGKKVIFLGHVPHHELPELYSKSWITFVPILMNDLDPFWDGSLKESLSCETPVVSFKRGIKSCQMAKKKFGLLLPTNKEKAAVILKEAINDIDNLRLEGRGGRRFIEEYCSWDKVIERLLEIYES